jgi:hypothetical protein
MASQRGVCDMNSIPTPSAIPGTAAAANIGLQPQPALNEMKSQM